MSSGSKYRVCLVGSGNWGSAIARIVGENVKRYDEFNELVLMWVFEEMVEGRKLSEIINTEHENVKYLKGYKIPENVVAVPNVVETVKGATILVFVMPHQFVKRVCEQIREYLEPDAFAVSLIKGLDTSKKGLVLTSSVIGDTLGGVACSVLMGANVANEVAAKHFCESTLGCTDADQGEVLRKLFHVPYFRVSVCRDACTVELCGALKNIIAIGAGICDGLGYGSNTKAAIIRIGLKEIMRVAKDLFNGGHESTFLESCGVSDLITTCYSGRNRKVAEAFVKTGKSFSELEREMLDGQKLQGPSAAAELHRTLKEKGIAEKYPLFTAIYRTCYEGLSPRELLENI
ncbi:glycerol-3-phosphate dehydrogenase [NAD(+)], cytoplasmic-like [Corticium candelabrum]|uniref:glycerol-3-phosphate dehydrogenase [NAD(+)], cytoplasmic-like n=1 Tax=Corticium candelabrum TaxID=121492 RepID=UPI002E255974|nr:glycerol-3-phosphate dehydrogenase [NAD(+)], cytoplasmic-like [Corticium candelabrum]